MSRPVDPLTAARELLNGPVAQPVAMTHSEIWALLATYQRRLSELVDLGERDALIELWAARLVAAESVIATQSERLAWYQAAMPDMPVPSGRPPGPPADRRLTRIK